MSKIITFQDGTKMGTFSQIKLNAGKRILISLTQTEIAVFKLKFGGNIPFGAIFKYNISDFIDCVGEKKPNIGDKSLLEYVVDIILPCKSIDEVSEVLNNIVK